MITEKMGYLNYIFTTYCSHGLEQIILFDTKELSRADDGQFRLQPWSPSAIWQGYSPGHPVQYGRVIALVTQCNMAGL